MNMEMDMDGLGRGFILRRGHGINTDNDTKMDMNIQRFRCLISYISEKFIPKIDKMSDSALIGQIPGVPDRRMWAHQALSTHRFDIR
jgi:hypothetical protein